MYSLPKYRSDNMAVHQVIYSYFPSLNSPGQSWAWTWPQISGELTEPQIRVAPISCHEQAGPGFILRQTGSGKHLRVWLADQPSAVCPKLTRCVDRKRSRAGEQGQGGSELLSPRGRPTSQSQSTAPSSVFLVLSRG